MESLERFYSDLSVDDRALLIDYLQNKQYSKKKNNLNIVMDLLHQCNLNCRGCGTNAGMNKQNLEGQIAFSNLKSIERACIRIREYADYLGKSVFINLGGGEPFLRKDVVEIVDVINSYFGDYSIGIDTNASLPRSYELISQVLPKTSYLGISINGLREYHNWYCGYNGFDSFERATGVVKKLCEDEDNRNILEVTSVATRENMEDLPKLFNELASYGVKKYSIHRAIPVGRMRKNMNLIPTAKDYLRLLIELIKVSEGLDASFHIHHSIENIHRAILLGDTTYCENKVGDRNESSSLGITPEGDLVFDAWCMNGIWKRITCGNIFYSKDTIKDMINNSDSLFAQVCDLTDKGIRCDGCNYPCAGGNRIVAAATKMAEMNLTEIDANQLKDIFRSIDPACPLYQEF